MFGKIYLRFNNNLFFPVPKDKAREILKWEKNKHYIVFSSSFDNKIKNVQLAKSAISNINNCNLIELKGYGKEQINLILNDINLKINLENNEISATNNENIYFLKCEETNFNI